VLDPELPPPLDPGTPAERVDGALVQIGLERLDVAEEELLAALRGADAARDAETAARAQEGLGSIAIRRGNTAAAIDWLERVLETAGRPDPAERIELYRALAQAYSETGKSAPAIALLEECSAELEGRPDADPATRVLYSIYLSHAYGDAGDYGRAAAALADALRRDVEEIDRRVRAFAYHALARLYCTTGHTAQALVYADKQVELTEASGNDWHAANAHLVRAHILLDDAQTDAAREALQATRRLYGERMSGLDEGWVVVEEARLALQAGDPDGAIDQARQAIELLGTQSAPGELGDAYLVLARGYDELGRADRAEAAYASAIDALRKQNGWHCELGRAYRWYGKFLRRAGRAGAAMDAFEQAADLAPSNLAVLELPDL
jgi:tetratricopeptide (TPR) repeat protein